MTKFIYLLPYYLLKFLIFLFYKGKITTNTRNSILFYYFKIFKSDLDITITTKSSYPTNASKTSEKIIKLLPYVKEVNQFYFENLKFIDLMNYFEATRSQTPINEKSDVIKKIEAQVFILRMLQSNLQQLTGPIFEDHTISKWKFYFDLTSISYDELIKTDDIILSIKKTLPNYSLALSDVIDKLTNSTLTTREKFHALTYKRESLILFPHIFTSIKYDFKFESDEEEIFYISQLSWEILGISTQIIHIENNLEAIKHIKNIEFHLKESVFNSAYAQDQSLKILKLIEKLNHYFLTEYC